MGHTVTEEILSGKHLFSCSAFFFRKSTKIGSVDLISADYPSEQKRCAICTYHKDFLPINVNNVKLFEWMLKLSSECKWETVHYWFIVH